LQVSRVIVIGLTGNIATGKSTVMAMLARRGALAIDADRVVHRLLDTDEAMQSQVIARFGPELGSNNGGIDRDQLAAIVFQDPAEMQRLEAILHPWVGTRVNEMILGSNSPVVVIEAIKLLESDLRQRCQSIWVTTCREEQQIQRLVSGRGMTRDSALARIRSQSPQEEKLANADTIIDTSGSLEQTEEQVERAWRELLDLEAR
jgi:dephospho-CoA kinase